MMMISSYFLKQLMSEIFRKREDNKLIELKISKYEMI